ncbi:MAG: hypothetical protein H7196_01840 [candidate division SR1 bacterium]|nr:hypothetical protein [candidate division SR1 bacterium]
MLTPESPTLSSGMSAIAKLNALKACKIGNSSSILPKISQIASPIESLETNLELVAINTPNQKKLSPIGVTAFEPPTFSFSQKIPDNQPSLSTFSDIEPLAPTQPVVIEQIPAQPPINQFIQNHAEIQPMVPEQTPCMEKIPPIISDISKLLVATPPSLEVVQIDLPTIKSKINNILSKINLPFMRNKKLNEAVEPSLKSTSKGAVNGAFSLELHFIKQLGEHKGQR